MNLTIFNKLMKAKETRRHPPEWKMFMEVCDLYLKRNNIKNPIVLGPENQRIFFEKLFNAKFIVGMHKGADILSIPGGRYMDVKRTFETYAPYCKGIIAIHDIECCRYKNRAYAQSHRVWDEIKIATACGETEFENFLFLAIHRKRIRGNQRGIGVIIKQ